MITALLTGLVLTLLARQRAAELPRAAILQARRPGLEPAAEVDTHLRRVLRPEAQVADVAKGGYVLVDCDGTPELILIATGSEVQLAVDAAAKLSEQGKAVRVVSMPSTDVFDRQDAAYRESVLPSTVVKRVAVEALSKESWYKYVGFNGAIVGMDTFGESAPAGELFKHFNITVDAVVEAALGL